MLRILGLVVLLVAGCGVRQQEASAQAPPGSVEGWIERMRQAGSVRFDVKFTSEGRQPRWWTRTGEMSPLSKVWHQEGQPRPVQRMVQRSKSHYSDAVFESQAIERFSREIYLQDTHVTMPPGKRWVKLDINAKATWAPNVERSAMLALYSVHPDSVFVDLDRQTLVISPGTADHADGVPSWRYELTAAANVESNSNTARKKPVEATVWVNHSGLPVKVEQRSTGEDGNKNTTVTKYSDWDATPPVEIPPAAEIADAGTVTWTDRW
jgi:hypothetical protein